MISIFNLAMRNIVNKLFKSGNLLRAVFFLALSLGMLLPFHWADALVTEVISSMTRIFFNILSDGATIFFDLSVNLFNWITGPIFNRDIFLGAPFVIQGWLLTRDIANMFFIFWLVIIALATILDIGPMGNYAAKRTLAFLILIAILVNFSLVISGFILDISQGAFAFLVNGSCQIKGNTKTLAECIRETTNVDGILSESVQAGSEPVAAAANAFTKFVLLMIAAILFLLLTIMLIVRIVAIWILLIVAPLAWVGGIMPFGKTLWNKWWSLFWHWAFYGVIVAFMIYLAVLMLQAITESQWGKGTFSSATGGGSGPVIVTSGKDALTYIVVVVFLFLALKLAQSGARSGGDALTGYFARVLPKAAIAATGTAALVASYPVRAPARAGYRKGKETAQDFFQYRVKGGAMRTAGTLLQSGRLKKLGRTLEIRGKELEEKASSKYFRDLMEKSSPKDIGDMYKESNLYARTRTQKERFNSEILRVIHEKKLNKDDLGLSSEQMVKLMEEARLQPEGEEGEIYKGMRARNLDVYAEHKREQMEREVRGRGLAGPQLNQALEEMEGEYAQHMDEVVRQADKMGELAQPSKDVAGSKYVRESLKRVFGDRLKDKVSRWSEDARQAFVEGLEESVSSNYAGGQAEVEDRKLLADISEKRDIYGLFFAGPDGRPIDRSANPQAMQAAKDYIRGLKGRDFEKITASSSNAILLARHLRPGQVGSAGEYIKDPAFQDLIIKRAKERNEDLYKALVSSDLWATPETYEEYKKKKKQEGRRKDEDEGPGPEPGSTQPPPSGGGPGSHPFSPPPGGGPRRPPPSSPPPHGGGPRRPPPSSTAPSGSEEVAAAQRPEIEVYERTAEPREVHRYPDREAEPAEESPPKPSAEAPTSAIITPPEEAPRRFRQGIGWTKPGIREVQEARSRKYQEYLQKKKQA